MTMQQVPRNLRLLARFIAASEHVETSFLMPGQVTGIGADAIDQVESEWRRAMRAAGFDANETAIEDGYPQSAVELALGIRQRKERRECPKRYIKHLEDIIKRARAELDNLTSDQWEESVGKTERILGEADFD